MRLRGQASAEFVALLLGVLVVVLVALSLSDFAPWAVDARTDRSHAYWSSQARPIEVTDWHLETKSAPGAAEANLSLILENADREPVVVRAIYLYPGTFENVYYANGTGAGKNNSLSIRLAPGESVVVYARHSENGSGAYVPPGYYEFNLSIQYDKFAPGGWERGRLPVAGTNKYQ